MDGSPAAELERAVVELPEELGRAYKAVPKSAWQTAHRTNAACL